MTEAKHSFLTHAAIYGIGGVLMQVAGVVLLPLYTHYLTPGEYGILEIIERIGRVINICLMAGGVRQAALAFYLQSDTEQDKKKVASSITLFIIAIFSVVAAAIFLAAPWLAQWMEIETPSLIVFGVVTVAAELFLVVPLTLMQARVESIAFVAINLTMLVVRISLAVLFIAVFDWGIWGAYWALLITFTGFGLILSLRELMKGSFKVDWQKCCEVARFSVPFIPTGLCFFVLYNGDRFFLLGTAGKEAVGLYALGYKLAECVGIISSGPLFKVWAAQMYETFKLPDAAEVAGRMLTRMLLAYSFVGVSLCLFHQEALALLSDEAYAEAGSIIAPVVLANGFLFASIFIEGVFYVYRRTALKPWTAAAGTAITLTLYAILIPRYSIHGAAYATLIGYAFMALVTFLVARRVFAVHYEPGRLAALLLVSVAVYLPASNLPLTPLSFLIKCLLIASWAGLVWFARIIRTEDKQILIHHLQALVTHARRRGLRTRNEGSS